MIVTEKLVVRGAGVSAWGELRALCAEQCPAPVDCGPSLPCPWCRAFALAERAIEEARQAPKVRVSRNLIRDAIVQVEAAARSRGRKETPWEIATAVLRDAGVEVTE